MAGPYRTGAPGGMDRAAYRELQRISRYVEDLEERIKAQGAVLEVPDTVLTDAWATLTPNAGYGELSPGTYLLMIYALATGSNNNAEAQFRINDGSTVIEGSIRDVGNETMTIAASLVIPQGVSFALEARGQSCTLTNIDFVLSRIGAG